MVSKQVKGLVPRTKRHAKTDSRERNLLNEEKVGREEKEKEP
jgi:hypothetical protein